MLAGTGIAGVAASLAIIAVYFTTAHGDRPRWREATALVGLRLAGATTSDVDVVSDTRGVVAHYLGVPPGQTMGHPLVRAPAWTVTRGAVARETWFVVEDRLVPPASRLWLLDHCELRGTFPTQMVVRDRTVVVYRCLPGQI